MQDASNNDSLIGSVREDVLVDESVDAPAAGTGGTEALGTTTVAEKYAVNSSSLNVDGEDNSIIMEMLVQSS